MKIKNSNTKYLVGVIMGSKSDNDVMRDAHQILDEFGVAHEIRVVSAHRTPDRMYEYAKSAEKRGIKVIIAGAGGSAHLPGMTAAITDIPVIGVAIATKGKDPSNAIGSMVDMPPGVPLGTIGTRAGNAALYAIRILAVSDEKLRDKLKDYRQKQEQTVFEADEFISNNPDAEG